MVYVIDIDGTICSKNVEYSKSEPHVHRIKQINQLYEKGHTIIYMTARGMGRHKNNPLLAVHEFFSFTEQQLKAWGAKYHQLILGKPAADYYIDDKGIEADEFFKHES